MELLYTYWGLRPRLIGTIEGEEESDEESDDSEEVDESDEVDESESEELEDESEEEMLGARFLLLFCLSLTTTSSLSLKTSSRVPFSSS